jgi:polyisoprenoid-binding protein YceI
MTKTMQLCALFIAALVARPVMAQDFTPYQEMPAGVYKIDKSHASLIWKVSHAGLSNYTARFKSFDAQINFNPKDVTKSNVTATIDPTSLETDYVATSEKDFNQNLITKEEWFNAKKFPKITFSSRKIVLTDKTSGKIYGDLTLLGVKKPIVMDVVLNGAYKVQPFSQKPTFGFSATTSINRSEWGLATYSPVIGEKVDIVIEAEFAQTK